MDAFSTISSIARPSEARITTPPDSQEGANLPWPWAGLIGQILSPSRPAPAESASARIGNLS